MKHALKALTVTFAVFGIALIGGLVEYGIQYGFDELHVLYAASFIASFVAFFAVLPATPSEKETSNA